MSAAAPAGGLHVLWLDVFADRPFEGNPLAVVLDADALDDHTMGSLAAELGLSETVFVLEAGARLRIFTPRAEIPLAGHPVVGAALALARLGRIPSEGRTVFATGAGDVPVDMTPGGEATMTQPEPLLGPELDRGRTAALLGLDALAGAPQVCRTALPQAFAEVEDRAALARASPDLEGIAALEGVVGLAAWCEDPPGVVAQRFFAPLLGVPEDPATGSAAGALGALRVYRGAAPGRVTIAQGAEVGRPSTIAVEVGGAPGSPGDVRVGGHAVLVLEAVLDRGVMG